MRLSILICSLKGRSSQLNRLLAQLAIQSAAQGGDTVEVITEIDNGKLSVGRKRNQLMARATGDYCCFVDDDDMVSHDYVSKIITALESNPDCAGIEGVITTNGKDPHRFIHSIKYNAWYTEGGIHYRTVNHLNPVKRSIAIAVPFPEINFGEDHDFSKRLAPNLRTEVFINGPIYHYLYITRK